MFYKECCKLFIKRIYYLLVNNNTDFETFETFWDFLILFETFWDPRTFDSFHTCISHRRLQTSWDFRKSENISNHASGTFWYFLSLFETSSYFSSKHQSPKVSKSLKTSVVFGGKPPPLERSRGQALPHVVSQEVWTRMRFSLAGYYRPHVSQNASVFSFFSPLVH